MCTLLHAKSTLVVKGTVYNQSNKAMGMVSIAFTNNSASTVSLLDGSFEIASDAKLPLTLSFSYIGYESVYLSINTKSELDSVVVIMQSKNEYIDEVGVYADKVPEINLTVIDPSLYNTIPSAGIGVESLVKMQMGVSSNNELSSQYRVRGGSYDENLVYINDIEVYRPFLIRAGQQEGLSLVNPNMVSNINFSSGGFGARYGDKMSSVLDVTYKQAKDFEGNAYINLLGAGASFAGTSANGKLSHTSGIRYKTNSYLLGTLDTEGEYSPNFADLQSYLVYRISKKLNVDLLLNVANNTYNFEPQDRSTNFGTAFNPQEVKIYFEGEEQDRFQTAFIATSLEFNPNAKSKYKLIFSGFRTSERENYDILSQYWIQNLSITSIDDNQAIGIGSFLQHARNYLYGDIKNIAFRANNKLGKQTLEWEVKYQNEYFSDIQNEWQMVDSAGYSLPIDYNNLNLDYSYNTSNKVNSNRFTAFIQDNVDIDIMQGDLKLNYGLRASYWDFNNEFIWSPRLSARFIPNWDNYFSFKLAGGVYYQTPFYKEYRAMGMSPNSDIKSQRSIQIVAGFDKFLPVKNKLFKYTTEVYYKNITDMIPYTVDNVRIQYSGKNNAKGYVYGLDMKLYGEFVDGVDSWINLSLMNARQDILDDGYIDSSTGELVEPGYMPMPSDERLNFSMTLQDYLPKNPSIKASLTMMYATGLPFGPPDNESYEPIGRMSAYRRVDVGIYKEISGAKRRAEKQAIYNNQTNNQKNKSHSKKVGFKNVWLGLELFNLFDTNNTISYLWLSDVNNNQYAVPNYLTSRRVNIKLSVDF